MRCSSVRRQRLEVGEIETQPVRVDQRAFLLHVLAQHFAQRGVHQVGRGMVETCSGAPLVVDQRFELIAHRDGALGQFADVDNGTLALLAGIQHPEHPALFAQHAAVAHLATGFGVKRGVIQHHNALIAGLQAVHRLAVHEQAGNRSLIGLALVTGKLTATGNRQASGIRAAKWLAARARSRCAAISASKPGMSIRRLRSRAMSAVRSTGKP